MEAQKLFKGELMEELLRNYFKSLGYFVVRGIKYKYESNDITDVDLFLYGRQSSLIRNRINVDIKNKKSPQAFERILYANGVKNLLNFDSCIVATTDKKPVIHSFGLLHQTIVLDGNFLSKLKADKVSRFSEEDLGAALAIYKSYNSFNNKDWRFIYDSSKSRLLTELDFSGYHATVLLLRYFLEKILIDSEKRKLAMRMVFLIAAHSLIIMDFILKDVVFLDQESKEKKLAEGFKFGNLGKDGVDKIIALAAKISNKSASSLFSSMENSAIEILRDFFSKNENSKNLHTWAKEFEEIGYHINDISPNLVSPPVKGIICLYLDYFGIERRKFFELFS